ncbi:MAG: hypothetical protein DRJ56_03565 [Thermoprotei archaeon]|nr:MAG: hypothetical protein DRJ56_03565 [Thermoprotei archaeon]
MVAMEGSGALAIEERGSRVIGYIKSQRLRLIALVYATLLASLAIGVFVPLPLSYAEYLADLYNRTIAREYLALRGFANKTLFILFNNMKVLILSSVPVMGPIFMYYTALSAGMVLNALAATSSGRVTHLQVLVTSLTAPSTWLELLAFSIVTSESILLSVQILKKGSLKDEAFYMAAALIVSSALLLISASVEALATIAASR